MSYPLTATLGHPLATVNQNDFGNGQGSDKKSKNELARQVALSILGGGYLKEETIETTRAPTTKTPTQDQKDDEKIKFEFSEKTLNTLKDILPSFTKNSAPYTYVKNLIDNFQNKNNLDEIENTKVTLKNLKEIINNNPNSLKSNEDSLAALNPLEKLLESFETRMAKVKSFKNDLQLLQDLTIKLENPSNKETSIEEALQKIEYALPEDTLKTLEVIKPNFLINSPLYVFINNLTENHKQKITLEQFNKIKLQLNELKNEITNDSEIFDKPNAILSKFTPLDDIIKTLERHIQVTQSFKMERALKNTVVRMEKNIEELKELRDLPSLKEIKQEVEKFNQTIEILKKEDESLFSKWTPLLIFTLHLKSRVETNIEEIKKLNIEEDQKQKELIERINAKIFTPKINALLKKFL